MHDPGFEQADRIDRIARALAGGTTRRRTLARLGGIAGGVLLPLARSSGISAHHKTKHCAKDGKRCHKHKECCGLCGPNGSCQSCAGVVTWADLNLSRLEQTDEYADSAIAAIRDVPLGEPFDLEILQPIADASAAIKQFSTALSTEVTPPPAADLLRTLLEIFAAMANELDRYIDQVSQEAYLETEGHRDAAVAAITNIAAGIPPLEAETTALRDACDG